MGGPGIYSMREIGQLAFEIQGKPPVIKQTSPAVASFAIGVSRFFNMQKADMREIIAHHCVNDAIGPTKGKISLETFFESLRQSKHITRRGLVGLD